MSNEISEYSDKKTVSDTGTPQKRKTPRKRKCPMCGGHSVAKILYGYVVSTDLAKMEKDLDEGKIALGGCCVQNEKWQCNDCYARW